MSDGEKGDAMRPTDRAAFNAGIERTFGVKKPWYVRRDEVQAEPQPEPLKERCQHGIRWENRCEACDEGLPRLSDEVHAALCFALWHHQGGSSPVGQPIRKILGIGQHDHMTAEQYAAAKRVKTA